LQTTSESQKNAKKRRRIRFIVFRKDVFRGRGGALTMQNVKIQDVKTQNVSRRKTSDATDGSDMLHK